MILEGSVIEPITNIKQLNDMRLRVIKKDELFSVEYEHIYVPQYFNDERKTWYNITDVPLYDKETAIEACHKFERLMFDKCVTVWEKNVEESPSVDTLLKVFKMFEEHGLIKDGLSFDPEHFMETVIMEHWNDEEPGRANV